MVERIVVGMLKTNCYIYSSAKKECVIIDPGGEPEDVAARVDVLNMVPVGIVLTHGHLDHVAAVGKLKASYAERGYPLSIAIHPADRKFLGAKAPEAHRTSLESLDLIDAAVFGDEFPPLPKADLLLKDGDRVLGMDLEVIETPGHTAGSVCLWSSKEGILFSGDTLFFDGVGRTDLAGGDEKKLRASLQRRIMVLPPETRVFPGHGPFTTIERERKTNPFMRATP
jgi:hydroxyacylglutathione hydrolase